jgi:hypothetical protein
MFSDAGIFIHFSSYWFIFVFVMLNNTLLKSRNAVSGDCICQIPVIPGPASNALVSAKLPLDATAIDFGLPATA